MMNLKKDLLNLGGWYQFPANIEKLMRLKLIMVEAELMLYIITIKYLPLNINLKYLYNALNSKDTNNKRLFSKIFLAGQLVPSFKLDGLVKVNKDSKN